jgi:MFS family permease
VLSSLPAGVLAARIGPRRTVVVALVVIALSSLAFAVANSMPLLILARAGQGFGAAAVWTGGLAWIVAVAPRERRIEAMGTAIGAAIAGALGGPVLGAAADVVGREAVFAAFVALPAVLVVLLLRLPDPDFEPLPSRAALLTDRGAQLGILLMATPSAVFGAVNVLVPLQLDDLGAGAAAIAAVFLVAVVLESAMSPQAGRMADRLGAFAPARRGLLLGAAGLVVLAFVDTRLTVGIAVVVALGFLGLLWAPAMAVLGDAAEQRGLNPAFAYSLGNLAWGGGTSLGGLGAGAVAGVTADAVPYLALAALAAVIALRLGTRSGSRTTSTPRTMASARSPGS